ncbi:MAG TPA: alpha/beta fold hydrolase [Solirubrobacteraceae bacterium]|jgi:pimeloyl-ACP methyl ester carboxylesterase|nr:alpha/beta fold hydrolase [Solirubrobacteraceae bacterium]
MPPRKLAPAILATVLAVAALASADASASTASSPCAGAPTFTCTTIPVPLARNGAAPGTIPLAVERLQAGLAPSQSAVLALAGGPGQAADPLASFIAKAIAPALHTRDLIVYDQRGTGRSDPLNCPALDSAQSLEGAGAAKLGERCAQQLGAARGAFTTQESVQDIEAIRAALGYEKLVLYGTSYGTKVALEYAERYPQHVEALVLDSVVPPEGPDPFSLPTFQALPSVLGELCAADACAHITTNPLADVARLTSALRRHPLSGSVYDGEGHRHAATLGEAGLLGILQAGDLNPALRALLPAAVQSALREDPDPLLRLNLLADGLIPNVPLPPHAPGAKESSEEEDNALFLATSCEEKTFPWQRTAPPATRIAQARAALSALPSADFYPFDAATAWAQSLAPICAGWPNLAPPPPATSALPNVPTLILSGAQDLRTPTSGARTIAARIPDSQLLVVPYTGHSVLGSDFSGCAQHAVEAFFGGAAVQPCKPTADLFSPTPITPTRLTYVQPMPGLAGNSGRTLTAVLDTLVDLERQVIGATLQAERELPSGASFGGLHGGYARLSSAAVGLHDLTFVPGVQLSGTLPAAGGKLHTITVHVGGAGAAPGIVVLGTNHRVSGTLGGQSFDLSTADARLSRAGNASLTTLSQLLALRLP